MKNTTIRISNKLLDSLKILKKDSDHTTYEKVLEELVEKQLKETYAVTYEGYIPVGAVVKIEDRTVVIETADKKYVNFSDGSWVFNESAACKRVKMLAKSIHEFEGVVK